MAASFSPDTPLVYSASRRSFDAAVGEDGRMLTAVVGVPAFAWEVLVPVGVRSSLDALQRAILGLARCDVSTADEHAAKLAVDRDLAALVLEDMQARRWIDERGELTAKGREAIEDDAHAQPKVDVYYVFQDPWTQGLWPRIRKSLDFAESIRGDGQYPGLQFGTVGRPYTVWPTYLLPTTEVAARRPTTEQIRRAAMESLRAAREVGGAERSLGPKEQVVVLDAEPTAIWIATELYVPADPLAGRRWRVADPFGISDLDGLRHSLREAHSKQRIRNGKLGRVLGNLLGAANDGDQEEAAELELEERLGTSLDKLPDLREDLLRIELARRVLCDERQDPRGRARAEDAARIAAGSVLERVLRAMCERMPPPVRWCEAAASVRVLGQMLSVLHGRIQVPDAFGRRTERQRLSNNDLVDLILRNAIAAASRHEHPLRQWLSTAPDRLSALDNVRLWRNPAAHAGRRHGWDEQRKGIAFHHLQVVDEIVEITVGTITEELGGR